MMQRRTLLLGALGGALVFGGCECPSAPKPAGPPPSGPPPVSKGPWRELSFPASNDYPEPEHAAILAVRGAPLLVALHGRGEAGRGLEAGARGWRDDYHLDLAHQRLGAPPLRAEDFHGFVEPARLAALNASLAANAYRGLAVACPYTPALPDRTPAGARDFAAFVTRQLVPRAQRELESKRVGIDGVSMGGRLALLVGLSHPETFDSVGALQPAIAPTEAGLFAELAERARQKRAVPLRLVSSHEDPFLDAVRALSAELERRAIDHELVVTPGPHDYVWNRGPGAYEMLLWHERVLRDLTAP